MWRYRMGLLLERCREDVKRSDAVMKAQWAARGVTDYRAAIKEWKKKGVQVPKDHPFYRWQLENYNVRYHSEFYRFFRSIANEGTDEEKATLWRIFGIH